ncbi:unnamed protein product, partial [Symbiodinium pilosum]
AKGGSCLTVLRDASTNERLFGKPAHDNFCSFAYVCFGLTCPLKPGAPEFPLLPLPAEEVLFAAEEGTSTCSKLMDNSCAAAYQQAELDCARDPHSRNVWDGAKQGLCPRCQKLVKAYHYLTSLCKTGGDFSMEALKRHFLERPTWQERVATGRFLAERREMGRLFERDVQDLLQKARKSCKVLKDEKRRRRAQLQRRQEGRPEVEEEEEGNHEEAEEEAMTVDDVVEVQEASGEKFIRSFFSLSTFPRETLPTENVAEKDKFELPVVSGVPPPGVPRHSVESLKLREKARKLALKQRYAEAAKLQKKAERLEAEWIASKYQASERKETDRLEERHALEKLRLEERLECQEAKLVEQSLRSQQLMLLRHDCSAARLVARQQRAWTALGGSVKSLEQALRSAAGRPRANEESDCCKMRRSASAPAGRRRPKSAMV